MANKMRFKRGLKTTIPKLVIGEPGITLDTDEVFIGTEKGNLAIATHKDIEGFSKIHVSETEPEDWKAGEMWFQTVNVREKE